MSDSMQITLANEGECAIRLVHTEASSGDDQSVIQGESSRWIIAPSPADKAVPIEPGKSSDIGTVGDVCFGGSSHFHWVYFCYDDDTTTIVQIGVIQRPSGGIWVQVGPFDTKSKSDSDANEEFMPKGTRPELVEYTDMSSIPAKVTIHVPARLSWKYFTQTPSTTFDLERAKAVQVALEVIDGALSTLLTTCFVVPKMLPWAVPLGGVQALLHLMTSSASENQRSKAFGAEGAFTATRLALLDSSLDSLRGQMDNVSAQYNAKVGGINSVMTSIAKRIDGQQHKTGEIVFDESLQADIMTCFSLFMQITDGNGQFQTDLLNCLNAKAVASDPAPPSKLRLALGIAAICITMNAHLYSFTLRSFILVEKNQWRPNVDLDRFSAESLLLYVSAKKGLIENYKIGSLATAQRLADIVCSTKTTTYDPPIWAMQKWLTQNYRVGSLATAQSLADFVRSSSTSSHNATITDPTLTTAVWGAGTVKKADAIMGTARFSPVEAFKTGVPYKWHSGDLEHRGSDHLYKGYTAYANHVKEDVLKEVGNVITRAMTELEEATIPYMAYTRRPRQPSQVPTMKGEIAYSSQKLAQLPTLRFRYVRYGFAFQNAAGVIGDILWQTWPPTELTPRSSKDGEKDVFSPPVKCTVTFPKDEWNQRAKDLAAKASAEAVASKQPAPVILPAYPTTTRLLYRRLYKSQEKGDTIDAVADETDIGMLPNNSATDDFEDIALAILLPKNEKTTDSSVWGLRSSFNRLSMDDLDQM